MAIECRGFSLSDNCGYCHLAKSDIGSVILEVGGRVFNHPLVSAVSILVIGNMMSYFRLAGEALCRSNVWYFSRSVFLSKIRTGKYAACK